ncbi:MAG: hypothetical protein ACFNZW_09535, partial [Coriobacteriaceae bacterium]
MRSFVDSLPEEELAELRGALVVRLCRKNYGTDTLEGLLAKWGAKAFVSGMRIPGWTELPAPSAHRCPKCHLRYGALAGTVFTNAKLTMYIPANGEQQPATTLTFRVDLKG